MKKIKKQKTLDGEISKEIKVRCEICGREFKFITAFHLKTHDITMHEYKVQFPDALLASDGYRKKKSEERLGKPFSELHKQHLSDNHADMSNENNPFYGHKHTDEAKQKSGEKEPWNKGLTKETDDKVKKYGEKHSKTLKEFNATEKGQKWLDEHMRRENSPAYIDGTSNFPYCEKFDYDLKERVREFFGRCCYVCGKNEKENGRKLDVHHVNFDKMVCCNDVKPLFVPLCRSCHTKTNGNRKYWEEFFSISLKCLTKDQCFLPKEVNKN